MFEKVKEIFGMLVITLFFGLITGILIVNYIEEYSLTSTVKEEVVVVEKVGEKGLFTPPAYFVRVELPDGEVSEYLNRISKSQMKRLDSGDTIHGFFSNRNGFSTIRDFLFDSLLFGGAILLFGFFTFCCLLVLVCEIPIIDQFLEKKTFLGRTSNGMKILTITIGVFIYFSGRFLFNLFNKLVTIKQTQTEATITDVYSNISYRRYEDSTFEFTLLFKDRNGEEIKVIKDVTRNTYDNHDIGESIPIYYRNINPYDISVGHTTVVDAFQTLFYVEIFVYMGLIAVIIFTGYVLYQKRKKKK